MFETALTDIRYINIVIKSHDLFMVMGFMLVSTIGKMVVNRFSQMLVIYERADFPHDNWWKQITVEYSDGDISTINLIKTDQGQVVKFHTKAIEWLILRDLIKADDPSPFPALTQIRVYGKG
ncbi:hypothetical protein [Butyrivibrio sp. LC3010]|uniref:hypothetical protein n=1 Tax=Butyrivibrio sp. LC3010 TaxID=1280680 RepID=UPI0004219399|nr:hypothetical protein [Butyrivibrio sp. LC3010]